MLCTGFPPIALGANIYVCGTCSHFLKPWSIVFLKLSVNACGVKTAVYYRRSMTGQDPQAFWPLLSLVALLFYTTSQ